MPGLKANEKNLTHRYLIWCYKTTKEELDKVDRYFTQLAVDEKVVKILAGKNKSDRDYQAQVSAFRQYMDDKKKRVLAQKYKDARRKTLQPEYQYRQARLAAIEKVILEVFGRKELSRVRDLYETEMTRRILEAREHR